MCVGSSSSVGSSYLGVDFVKEVLRDTFKAGSDSLSDEIFDRGCTVLDRDLDTESALSKAKLKNLCDLILGLCLSDHVLASDTEVDVTLTNEFGDIASGEEDEGDGEVLDEGNVETVLAVELNVGALEEGETSAVEAALLGDGEEEAVREILDEFHCIF